jgi:23S rRNA-/tRNA-specific pseudouridylate synthase
MYRIDRLTSGVVVIAKTEGKAKEFHQLIQNRKVSKVYLSKVVGVFPR